MLPEIAENHKINHPSLLQISTPHPEKREKKSLPILPPLLPSLYTHPFLLHICMSTYLCYNLLLQQPVLTHPSSSIIRSTSHIRPHPSHCHPRIINRPLQLVILHPCILSILWQRLTKWLHIITWYPAVIF